jgi:predicted HTH domain antitoxin
MDVVVTMPDQVARQWGDNPKAIGRHVVEDAVIERYRAGRLSHRQVGEVLGLDYWQVETFLKERGVPLNYSAEDLESDRAALGKIFPRS